MAYTLQIESGDDSREVEFLMKPSFADIDAVLRSFSGQVAKYSDEEGDLCTLTESTFEDFLVTSQQSRQGKQNMLRLQLPALELGECPPSPSPSQCSSISASWTRVDDPGFQEPEKIAAAEVTIASDCEDSQMDQSLTLQGLAEGSREAVEPADDLTPVCQQSDTSATPPPLGTVPTVALPKADPWASKFTNALGGLVLNLGIKPAVQATLPAPQAAEEAGLGESAAPVLADEPKETEDYSNFRKSSLRPAQVEQTGSEVDNPADIPKPVLSKTEFTSELDSSSQEVIPSRGEGQADHDKSLTFQGVTESSSTAAAELAGDPTPPGETPPSETIPDVPMSRPDPWASKFANTLEGLVLTLGSNSAAQVTRSAPEAVEAASFGNSAASLLGDEPKEAEEGRRPSTSMVLMAPTPMNSEKPAAVAKTVPHSAAEATEESKETFETTRAGASSLLEANLLGTALPSRVPPNPKDEPASSCKVCHNPLELHLQAPFKRWCCDVCDRRLTCNDSMWACPTAEACNWGMCSDCCYLARTSYSQAKVQAAPGDFSPSASQHAEIEIEALRVHFAKVLEDVPSNAVKEAVCQMLDVLPQAERDKIRRTIEPAACHLVGESPPEAAPTEHRVAPSFEEVLVDADPKVVKLSAQELLHQLTAAEFTNILEPLEEAARRALTFGQTAAEEVDEPTLDCNLAQAAAPSSGASASARASTEQQACRCKNCSEQLELHLPGPFQRWICDLCDRHFEKQDPMWACSSAKNCNWGVCMDCYELAGTDVNDHQTSCRSQALSSCSGLPLPYIVAGAMGVTGAMLLGGPLLALPFALGARRHCRSSSSVLIFARSL